MFSIQTNKGPLADGAESSIHMQITIDSHSTLNLESTSMDRT